MRIFTLIVFFLFLSGCSSISKDVSWDNGNTETSEVLVYRLPGPYGKADMFFGSSEGYVMTLAENEYATLEIPAGKHTFRANAKSSKSDEIEVTLAAGQRTCLEGTTNPNIRIVFFLPFLGATIPHFQLREVTCPEPDQLEQYALIEW